MKSKIDKELVKAKIENEDKIKLEFKRKLSDIKAKYGLDFDIELLENYSIDTIKFFNLKYKNKAREVSLIYYNETDYYGAYIYKINKNTTLEDVSYLDKKNYFDKEYKLPLVIEEIKKAHHNFKKKLSELNKKYSLINSESADFEKELINTNA